MSLVTLCTTKKRGYLHLNLATDNSVAKFSNGFATDYIYIIFLILATDNPLQNLRWFSNRFSVTNWKKN
jgi:hypothetical protein